MPSVVTKGLSKISVGTASEAGVMPTPLTKIGAVLQDSAKLAQAKADVIEHFEEGSAAAKDRSKIKKMPTLTFTVMDPDAEFLADYVGGTTDVSGEWSFNGTEVTLNKAVKIEVEQGLEISIPNADIEATIGGGFSKKELITVELTITPMAVTNGKPITAKNKA